jgi:transglutaminase-like putative cysteine protease
MSAVIHPQDGVRAISTDPADYLGETWYINHADAKIRAMVDSLTDGCATDLARAVALFYGVRDSIRYNPYSISGDNAKYRATAVVEAGEGWCVTKGALMTACARRAGIPARPGYADVRNHLTSERLAKQMGTDIFAYHGYVELWLADRWVKATPVFNIELCEKFGVAPQEFDGASDSLFQEFDTSGRKHMEYVLDRGPYTDIPVEEIRADFTARYPYLIEVLAKGGHGDLAAEAEAEAGAERTGTVPQ